jgi:hypothetical protein
MQQTELQNISEDRMHRMHVGLSFLEASILGDQGLTQGPHFHHFQKFDQRHRNFSWPQHGAIIEHLPQPRWPNMAQLQQIPNVIRQAFSQAACAQMLQQTLSPNNKTLLLSDSLLNRLMAIDGLICLRRDQCFD